MKKVSFDFDSTLSRPEIQKYAKELKENGFDVWIVTSRQSELKDEHLRTLAHFDNQDLFNIAEEIGIQRDKIIFTEHQLKVEFFKDNNNFLFHLDDDHVELKFINKETKVKGISCWKNTNWKKKCNKILGL
jgi:hypothetical protein